MTAAETVLHGGPAALLAASGRESLSRAEATSLLEPSTSQGWLLARELERRLLERVPVTGVSLVLDRLAARPDRRLSVRPEAIERLLGSRLRRLFQRAPGALRVRGLERLPRD